MEETVFDTLLRKAAQQATRRETLGALLGGAFLLADPVTSEATDKAQRRRKRKRRNGAGATGPIWKDVSFWVNNRAGSAAISGSYGIWTPPKWIDPGRCSTRTFTLGAGGAERFFAGWDMGYVWFADYYFFSFVNPFVGMPNFSAAYGGRASFIPAQGCPSPVGTDVVKEVPLEVGQEIPVTLDGKAFRVKRYGDTSTNKIFEIVLPAGL